MATFLQLCQDFALKSGAVDPAPATVVGPLPRRQAQCVAWVAQAWRAIQNLTPQWSFMRTDFTAALSPGVASYYGNVELARGATATVPTFRLPRFAEFVQQTPGRPALSLYDPDIGRRDESWLTQIDIGQWRGSYDFGAVDAARPTVWAVGDDGTLKVGAPPDRIYQVRGEYRKSPQVLAADTDVPDMPERFHDAIVFRAIMLMAESDEAPAALQTAQFEFGQLIVAMQNQLLPKIGVRTDGPLDRR